MLSPNLARQVLALSGVAADTLRAWQRDPSAVREISRLRIERALAELGLSSILKADPNSVASQPLAISTLGVSRL